MTEAPERRAPSLALSLADFELLRRIGDGSYSHVVLARHKATGKEYALKVVDKQYIIRHKVVEHIKRERQILDSLADPGIVQLFFTFQDARSLYLGLEHCPNGELYDQIRLKGRLEEAAARFYAAEVVLMLGNLRQHAVAAAHRLQQRLPPVVRWAGGGGVAFRPVPAQSRSPGSVQLALPAGAEPAPQPCPVELAGGAP